MSKKSKPIVVRGELGSVYVIPEEFRTLKFLNIDWQKVTEEELKKLNNEESKDS